MRYQGGKSKLSKEIVNKIKELYPNSKEIWEPFCGGGAITLTLAQNGFKVHASDSHEDLILMWQALMRDEKEPFSDVSEEEYRALKHAPSSARRGFVGYAASFGAAWFGGWARDSNNKRNFLKEGRENNKRLYNLPITFTHADYTSTPDDVLVYADPPYYGTKEYRNKFDHLAFWEWVLNRSGPTFVSELIGPDCLEVVWKKQHKSQNASNSPVTKNTSSIIIREEKLFYCPGKAKI